MRKVFQWAKRRRYFIIGGFACLLIGIAGYLGYLTSQSQAAQEIPTPPTIAVEKGEVLWSVTAPGHLTTFGEAILHADVNGPLDQILVKAGDSVGKGQVLARIGNRAQFEGAFSDAQAALALAQSAFEAQNTDAMLSQAHLDLLKAEKEYKDAQNKRQGMEYGRASQATLDIARANYVLAQTALKDAQEQFSNEIGRPEDDPIRAQAMSRIGLAAQKRNIAQANLNWLLSKPDANEIGQADAQMILAKAKYASAKAVYERMQNGDFPEHDQAQANLNKARANLDKAHEDLDHLEIRAPFAGVITEVPAIQGQNVSNGSELIKMADPKQLEAAVSVVEEDLQIVKIGQPAQLYFEAVPEANLTGLLARIVPQRIPGERVLYPVFISLDEASKLLVSGMTVDASITIDKKENVLRLPRSVVHARADGTAELNVWDGKKVIKQTVKVGLRGDSYIEILSGLQEGDKVVSK